MVKQEEGFFEMVANSNCYVIRNGDETDWGGPGIRK
jgi:hypothetical protein